MDAASRYSGRGAILVSRLNCVFVRAWEVERGGVWPVAGRNPGDGLNKVKRRQLEPFALGTTVILDRMQSF